MFPFSGVSIWLQGAKKCSEPAMPTEALELLTWNLMADEPASLTRIDSCQFTSLWSEAIMDLAVLALGEQGLELKNWLFSEILTSWSGPHPATPNFLAVYGDPMLYGKSSGSFPGEAAQEE